MKPSGEFSELAAEQRNRTELAPVTDLRVSAYRLPMEAHGGSGKSLERSVLVRVEVDAGGITGWGYAYAESAAARLAEGVLKGRVLGRSAFDVEGIWREMTSALRTFGVTDEGAMAVSAVDCALWDLKGRLLGLPVADLLGKARNCVPVYGSGGFRDGGLDETRRRMTAWMEAGLTMAKLQVGADAPREIARVRAAREAIGPDPAIFVDAEGAFDREQAAGVAAAFAESGVRWFEEPVPARDLPGLREVRARAPASMDVACGETGCALWDFISLLDGVVDVVQADATRCLGVTGFIKVAALAEAHNLPLSASRAPSLHLHLGCALAPVRHAEFFHDHVRAETIFFDGFRAPYCGAMYPDPTAPGFGLEFKRADAERFRLA